MPADRIHPSLPLTAADFEALMARLGPFETAPRLAVAVSGGADSLALTLLAAEWARARGGRLDALTVDHGLRPESGAEAVQLGTILARRRIAHSILRWGGAKPASGIQEAARSARYALLENWCSRNGVLHLLLAHHREDQAETLLLRLGRGSGLAGLAAMAAVTEHRAVRLLRPLLGVGKDRLAATLAARDESWAADPSNENPAFGRVRLRRLLPLLAVEGATAERLAATARRLGRARQSAEAATAMALAESVSLQPEGYAWIDLTALARQPSEIRLRALAATTVCIGGLAYAPRFARLERLHDHLIPPGPGRRGRTLGGCLFVVDGLQALVCREPAAMAAPVFVEDCGPVLWDRRFRLRLTKPPRHPVAFGALGAAGWRDLVAVAPHLAKAGMRPQLRVTLPALRDPSGLVAVPHLGFVRTGSDGRTLAIGSLVFGPVQALAGPGFMLA